MIHFDTDYMRGAHPKVMEKIISHNLSQFPGYGNDIFCKEAASLIKKACDCKDALVFFLTGGTQTNSTIIDAVLKKHEGVICADSGHINVHESGAIEATGHKVLVLEGHEGKIKAEELEAYLQSFYSDETYEHMVAPGMVYISYPTEYGTLYSLRELKSIKKICNKFKIPLYIDGARLGYGLAANKKLTLPMIAGIADVFYIGGTKVGALFGEAVVVPKGKLIQNHVPLVKQHGALLAKGFLLGLQFSALFSDNLYLKLSENAIERALELKKGFIEKGYTPFIDSPTNQQFFILPNRKIKELKKICTFELWGAPGEHESTVRFVTDWATSREDIETLLAQL